MLRPALVLYCFSAVFRLFAFQIKFYCEVFYLSIKRRGIHAASGEAPSCCPYCGNPVVLRSADGIYKENSAGTRLYVCSKYPACDAYVRVKPGTRTPIGSLADGRLRALRHEAHIYFDKLHRTGLMSRDEAYEWLASMLQVPASQAHIGQLGVYHCQRVIEESKRLWKNRPRIYNGRLPACRVTGGDIHAAG